MQPDRQVALVLLAAGSATRFGSDKLAARLGDRPVLDWTIGAANAAGFAGKILVRQPGATVPRSAAGWTVIINENAAEGMASSIRCGVEAAAGYSHIVIALGDMPFVTAHYLAKLASREAPTFSRHHDGRLGCPALFAQSTFPALLSLTGERGAASLEFSPRHVMEPREPAMLDDIDEKQDLDSQAHQAPAAKLDG